MSAKVLVILVVSLGDARDAPASRAILAAIDGVLGGEARIEVAERVSIADARAKDALLAAIEWRDPARIEARVKVLEAKRDRWIARELAFEEIDAPSERGRAVGLAIGTMLARELTTFKQRPIVTAKVPPKKKSPPPREEVAAVTAVESTPPIPKDLAPSSAAAASDPESARTLESSAPSVSRAALRPSESFALSSGGSFLGSQSSANLERPAFNLYAAAVAGSGLGGAAALELRISETDLFVRGTFAARFAGSTAPLPNGGERPRAPASLPPPRSELSAISAGFGLRYAFLEPSSELPFGLAARADLSLIHREDWHAGGALLGELSFAMSRDAALIVAGGAEATSGSSPMSAIHPALELGVRFGF